MVGFLHSVDLLLNDFICDVHVLLLYSPNITLYLNLGTARKPAVAFFITVGAEIRFGSPSFGVEHGS